MQAKSGCGSIMILERQQRRFRQLADGVDLVSRGEFIVASGQGLPDYGRVKLSTQDEHGADRRITGSVTDVHQPLGSAGELSGAHDGFLWNDGGCLITKWSPIARALRQEFERLKRRYKSVGLLPLYKEGNLYNFYLEEERASGAA